MDSNAFSSLLGLKVKKDDLALYLEVTGVKWKEGLKSIADYNEIEYTQSITECGGEYILNPNIGILLSLRHQGFGTKYMRSTGTHLKNSTGALDFFTGVRVGKSFGNDYKWHFGITGIAGTGESDFVWSLKMDLKYNLSKKWSVSGSFRQLDTDFKDNKIAFDGSLNTAGLKIEYLF